MWLWLLLLVRFTAADVFAVAPSVVDISRRNITVPDDILDEHTRRIVESNESSAERPTCIVVAYDKYRGYLNWAQDWFKKAMAEKCSRKVVLLDNKRDIPRSNVVLFHAPTHHLQPKLHEMKKSGGPLFAMLSMEQPKYAPVLNNVKYLSNNMDLMITYSQEPLYPGSSIPNMPITYYPLNIVSPHAVMQPPRSFDKKDGFGTGVPLAVFTSNCNNAGAKQRAKYIQELMTYMQVHSYGRCFHNRDEPSFANDPRWPEVAQKRARKVKILSYYKFYLAFENAEYDDYVSEKVFEGLIAGTVPVYRGSRSIHKFMPSNDSFINANDMSPKELSNLLKALSSDRQEYQNYFRFKKKELPAHFVDMALRSYIHPNVMCRLCSLAVD